MEDEYGPVNYLDLEVQMENGGNAARNQDYGYYVQQDPRSHPTQQPTMDAGTCSYPTTEDGWTLGSSLFWTRSKHEEPFSSHALGAVYGNYPSVQVANHLLFDKVPAQPTPPQQPLSSQSFCEHGYPFKSSLSDEVPFVTVRKCKKGRTKAAKIEANNLASHKKRSSKTELQADTPTIPVNLPSNLPENTSKEVVNENRPIPAYTGARNGKESKPITINSQIAVKSNPAGQTNQATSKFVTREWRQTPKKPFLNVQLDVPPLSVPPVVEVKLPQLQLFQNQSQIPSPAKVEPLLSFAAKVPAEKPNIPLSSKDTVMAPVSSENKAEKPQLKGSVTTIPAQKVTGSAPVQPQPVWAIKTLHGKPGVIEVPLGLKADVFGNSPQGKLLPSPIFKQPTPGRESPKPIGPIMADDRPQGRCGNRKAKRQQERSSQQQQHEALQPTASATDAPPPDLPLQPTLTVATPAKLEPPSPMVVPDFEIQLASEEANRTVDIVLQEQGITAETAAELEANSPHPLETAWTLYHMNGATRRKGADWNSGIQTIGVFDTVESFFSGFNSTPRASETAKNQDYMFFRGGNGELKSTPVIHAAWEDEKNTKGGMWRFSVPMHMRGGPNKSSETVDFFWKEILMALIGEQFGEHNDFVNGCYFCNRGDEYRLQVWMGCNEPGPVTAVAMRLAKILELRDNAYFDYCSHEEINKKGNRYAKALHDQLDILRMLAAKEKSDLAQN